MKKKSKIIAGGILITSAIGTTSFAIIDPYNMLGNKKADVPEKTLKLTENTDKNKDDIDNKKEEDNINLNGIKDGIYLGISKGYGGDIKVNVTIENGKIKNIEVFSHSETPKYYENGSKVIASILKENSTNVDAISGATLTSNGIKNAVKDALSKAGFNIEVNNKEVSVSKNSNKTGDLKTNNITQNIKSIDLKEYKLKDGEYIGEAIGFKGNVKVKVIISGGKLADVKVISHNDDSEFFNKAKVVIIKILRNQGTVGVDTVSGATYSSRGILNAVNSALNKVAKENNGVFNTIKISENNNTSHKNNNKQINIKDIIKDALNQNSIMIDETQNSNTSLGEHKFKDGEYIGQANGFNGNVKVKVIIKNGTLVNIEIINHNDDEEFFNNAKSLIFKILKNQGTTGIDTVSGATYSSKGILNSVNEALKEAIKKDNIITNINSSSKDMSVLENNNSKEILGNNKKENTELSKDNNVENDLNNKDIKYLDGEYIGIGKGFTSKPIKSKVTFENNKIKSIQVATEESEGYGDDLPFRDKAIKIVDILKNDPEKTINDVLLLDEITNKILKSDNYYETGKQLIGDYAEKLKDVYKDTFNGPTVKTHSIVVSYLKEHKNASAFDAVSGATYSAKGIVKSVKDAMDKAANDYKTGNIVNDLKIKTPSEKNIFVEFIDSDKDKKLDLSNLKVVISTRDGKEKEIPYDKFKENDIEVYDKETGKPIYHEMNLNIENFKGMEAVIEHKKSLYKDKFIIIPKVVNKNYITGIEYSTDNGATWNKVSDVEKMNDSNNIHFKQEVKIAKEDQEKILFRLVSKNGDKYKLELKDKVEGPYGYYYFNPSKEDKAKNKNIPSGFYISFKFTDTSDNNVDKNLEKLSYARIYLNESEIYKRYQGKIKVGQKIDWTGAKFKFKDIGQDSIKNLFTEDELNKLKNKEEFKRKGTILYEDFEKLGIEISPKQDTVVTENMIPKDKNYTELKVELEYKGKKLKVRGGGINGDDDFAGIFLQR
ncbi:FMN-binding protein [Clostridium sp.]|uniref:FMN-binding protein n=1 Tax=Clostridium sp. TaxID=1506 RepID=UPI0026140772